jgi:hypothetical protein
LTLIVIGPFKLLSPSQSAPPRKSRRLSGLALYRPRHIDRTNQRTARDERPLVAMPDAIKVPAHETREALPRASAPPKRKSDPVASPASSTGYDSTSPYMEQKRGAMGRFLTCFSPQNPPVSCDKYRIFNNLTTYQLFAITPLRAPFLA